MPDEAVATVQCPTCHANTLPARLCPHCKRLLDRRLEFTSCSVCNDDVCLGCILVLWSSAHLPMCHRCSAKESADGN